MNKIDYTLKLIEMLAETMLSSSAEKTPEIEKTLQYIVSTAHSLRKAQ